MKTPAFWDMPNSFWQKILSPLGALYGFSVRRRFLKTTPYQPKIPVICVGNIAVGGTGKTPVCLALAEWFHRHGTRVVFLNHGYKSKEQGQVVDLSRHTFKTVSDEALLLAEQAPTVIDRKRDRGVIKAEKMDADVVIMDDGFQNPSVIKTMSLLVFDGAKGIGNGVCLPAGPLRETLKQGLKRADAVVIVGKDKTKLKQKIMAIDSQMPILTGSLKPRHLEKYKGKKGIAFAGIGRPEKFFTMLKEQGILLEGTFSFPDHHAYTLDEIKELGTYKGPLFTTPKDAVKIPAKALKQMVVVNAPFIFDNEEKWDDFLEKGLL